MSSYCRELRPAKAFMFCCIFLIHEQKWRIGHWQDFVNGTGGFACVLLLYVRVTVKFWQEQTFTWFPISFQNIHFSSAYSIVAFVIRFVLFLFLLFVLVQSFFLARAFACLHFFNLPVHNLSYGPLLLSKIGGFRTAQQPIRSHDFTESNYSYYI